MLDDHGGSASPRGQALTRGAGGFAWRSVRGVGLAVWHWWSDWNFVGLLRGTFDVRDCVF